MNQYPIINEQDSAIVRAAAQTAGHLFDQYHKSHLVFHNYGLTFQAVQAAQEIAAATPTDFISREIALITCWFLKIGYQVDYQHPLAQSIREVGHFFVKNKYPEDRRTRVVECIQSTGHDRRPETQEAKIVADAFTIASFLADFELQSSLLRLEWKTLNSRAFTDRAWLDYQKEMLLKVRLWTPFAKAKYSQTIGQQLLLIQAGADKKDKKEPPVQTQAPELFSGLEPNMPSRGAQTFFRTNYRNHINLSAIADNKANIMISVNSILISVLITLLSYRNIAETQPMILLPVTLFLITGLASLISAVLAARPKVTTHEWSASTEALLKKNMIFFGSFSQLPIEKYESLMDELLRDDQLLYGNMVRDLYYLGKVLDKKYRYLSISYNIFMMGFIITVVAFLWVLFQ
jgi:hypothetical protein